MMLLPRTTSKWKVEGNDGRSATVAFKRAVGGGDVWSVHNTHTHTLSLSLSESLF